MNKERIEKAKELFDQAGNLNPAEREKFLNEKCGADTVLKNEVLTLLKSLESTNDFLEEPLTINETLLESFQDPNIGKQIGNYLIDGEAGVGGMGIVYSGTRNDDEFKQKVAIKILKHGLKTEYLLQRFQIERQTLANLQHENIARLIDGGRTDDDLPYLIMEFIDGISITEYCNQKNLTIKERLKLFQRVCYAVQHAHQNLIIHRDIKPSNILVTEDGTPKLLDFGIAKLLDEDLAVSAEGLTRTGMWHLTPEYSSPEQIKGEKITTTSDIYSLGVLLYEILTGEQPYRITSSLPSAINKIITEENVLKPSDKVKQTEKNEGNIHLVNPQKLSHQLKGDLDNIVLKAMHKDPVRRYNSVEQFSGDINRFLLGYPVIAQKDTASYRISKFIQRHKVGFVSSVIFFLFLSASAVGIIWQANVAAGERDKAKTELVKFEEINNFLLEMLSSADPGIGSRDVKVYDLLEKAASDVDVNLNNQPKIKSAIKQTLGSTFIGLGEYEKAEALLLESLALNKKLFGFNSSETAKTYHQLGLCYDWIGKYDLADSFYLSGITTYEKVSEEPAKALADNLNDYGTLMTNLGHFDSAAVLFNRALDIYALHNSEKGKKEAITIINLAVNMHHQNKIDQAEKYYLQAKEIFERQFGTNIPEMGYIYNNLAFIYLDKNDFAKSEKSFKKAYEVKLALLGESHTSVGLGLVNLGMLYFTMEEYKKAEAPLLEAIGMFNRTNATKDPILSLGYYWLGRSYLESNQLVEAEEELINSIKIREEVFGNDHFKTWSSKGELGICYLNQKKYSEAEKLLVGALEFYKNDKYKDLKKIKRYTEYSAILYSEIENTSKAEFYHSELKTLGNETTSVR